MNRIISLIFILLLAFSVPAFAEESAPPVGKWYATSMEMTLEGTPVSRNPLVIGCSALLVVEDDGDGVLRLNSSSGCSESDIDWTFEDGRLRAELESGDVITFELTGDSQLKQTVGTGQYLYYSRDLPVAEESAAVIKNAAIDDFAGTWTVASVSQYDFSIEPDVAGVTGMQLTYDGGDSVMLLFPGDDSEPLECTSAAFDGVTLTAMDGVISLKLLEDGSMRATMPITFGMVDMIFTRE